MSPRATSPPKAPEPIRMPSSLFGSAHAVPQPLPLPLSNRVRQISILTPDSDFFSSRSLNRHPQSLWEALSNLPHAEAADPGMPQSRNIQVWDGFAFHRACVQLFSRVLLSVNSISHLRSFPHSLGSFILFLLFFSLFFFCSTSHCSTWRACGHLICSRTAT